MATPMTPTPTPAPRRNIIGDFIRGALIGLVETIPGVSGEQLPSSLGSTRTSLNPGMRSLQPCVH